MMNEPRVVPKTISALPEVLVRDDEEFVSYEVRLLKEKLESQFPDFLRNGVRLLEGVKWEPVQDARYIVANRSFIPSVWVNLMEDPSILQNKFLAKEIKGLLLQNMRNPQMVPSLARFLLAVNEALQLWSQMEFLDTFIHSDKESVQGDPGRRESCAELLKLLIKTNFLEKGWLRKSFPRGREASCWVAFFIQLLLELEEPYIEAYAQECAFYFGAEEPFHSSSEGLKSSCVGYPYVCFELYKQEQKKRFLFLQSLGVPLDKEMMKAFFFATEGCLEPIFLSIELSESARGFLFFQLLVDGRKVYREIHDQYIEQLLKRSEPLMLPDWDLFLPVEKNPQKKKERLQQLLHIIKNPRITHPFPILWIATLVAFILDLEKIGGFRRLLEEFTVGWIQKMSSPDLLPLTEEDYLLLSDSMTVFSIRSISLIGGNIRVGGAVENTIPLLQNIFVTLDKLRLSAENLPETPQIKIFIEKTENLMTEILTCFSTYVEPMGWLISPSAAFDPHKLVNSLFRKEITLNEVTRIMERIQSINMDLYPLFQPFLRSVGAFQKGGVLPTA